MSINRGMGKEDVRHIHMEYYSAIKKNETGPFVEMWMDLESIIEWSKSEKNECCILTHFMWSRKMVQMILVTSLSYFAPYIWKGDPPPMKGQMFHWFFLSHHVSAFQRIYTYHFPNLSSPKQQPSMSTVRSEKTSLEQIAVEISYQLIQVSMYYNHKV